MSLVYTEQMKFVVYKAKDTTRKELMESDLYLAFETIPNSKMLMFFLKAEKEIQNENGEKENERGNIQVFYDSKRNLVFVEQTKLSDNTHELVFNEYEVHGKLEIPGKKNANSQFVKKMLTMIRAYK